LETGAATLDLYFTARLLLNILDIVPTTADNLGPEVETLDGLKIDRKFLLGPFTLCSLARPKEESHGTYPTKLVTFELGFTTTEPALINKIWQFLLHKFLDLLYGSIEAFFRGTSNSKIQRRILRESAPC